MTFLWRPVQMIIVYWRGWIPKIIWTDRHYPGYFKLTDRHSWVGSKLFLERHTQSNDFAYAFCCTLLHGRDARRVQSQQEIQVHRHRQRRNRPRHRDAIPVGWRRIQDPDRWHPCNRRIRRAKTSRTIQGSHVMAPPSAVVMLVGLALLLGSCALGLSSLPNRKPSWRKIVTALAAIAMLILPLIWKSS